jgi:anti-sigma regulatory factor (Ser/Thr protein kinase)
VVVLVTNNQGLTLDFELKAGDFNAAGEASGRIKKVLQQIGIKADIIRRIAISAYEAEMNVIIHSVGGVMKAKIFPDRTELEIQDNGPGIDDIQMAMREGYSTAPDYVRDMGFGAGMGLPNMSRCSDQFDIHSQRGVGTEIFMMVRH